MSLLFGLCFSNTRLYYFNKINQNAETGTDEENEHSLQYKQQEEKWKSLSEAEKAEYTREYRTVSALVLSLLSARFFVSVTGHLFHQAELEYNRSFFKFAKTLPENRMVDYEFYLDRPIAKKPRAPRKSIIKSSQTAQVIREFAETNDNEKESPELK